MFILATKLPDPLNGPVLVLGVDCSDVDDGGELLVQVTASNST